MFGMEPDARNLLSGRREKGRRTSPGSEAVSLAGTAALSGRGWGGLPPLGGPLRCSQPPPRENGRRDLRVDIRQVHGPPRRAFTSDDVRAHLRAPRGGDRPSHGRKRPQCGERDGFGAGRRTPSLSRRPKEDCRASGSFQTYGRALHLRRGKSIARIWWPSVPGRMPVWAERGVKLSYLPFIIKSDRWRF